MSEVGRLGAVRAAHARVAEWLLDMQELVREFRHPLTGVTADSERAADGELHRLSCLSLALDPLDDDTGPDEARLTRLLTDPVEVIFTLATGETVLVERFTLDEVVATAERCRDRICQLVEAYRSAVRSVGADLDRVRRGLSGSGPAADSPDAGPGGGTVARLAVLEGAAGTDPVGCARPGRWRDALAALERDLAERPAREPDVGKVNVPPAAHRLRSSVDRLRLLAAEAGREGLAGGDPLAGLDVDALLARAEAGDRGDALRDALEQTADLVDAARRRLRGRCHRELRGRLEAYRQRAADEGRAEHPDLDDSYRTARDALRPDRFTVTGASRAVRAYQQAVNEVTR